MKTLFIMSAALAASSAFAASPGIDPTETHIRAGGRASCSRIQYAVRDHGAVILHYGNGLFERVVSSSSFCPMGETMLQPFWLNGCFTGYTCETNIGG